MGLKVQGEIEELGILSENLNRLDRSLFMGLASFVLAKGGFKDVTMYNDSRYEYNDKKSRYEYKEYGEDTTTWDEDTWVSAIHRGLTQWTEELREIREEEPRLPNPDVRELDYCYYWSHVYKHSEDKRNVAVVFLPDLGDDFDISPGQK